MDFLERSSEYIKGISALLCEEVPWKWKDSQVDHYDDGGGKHYCGSRLGWGPLGWRLERRSHTDQWREVSGCVALGMCLAT